MTKTLPRRRTTTDPGRRFSDLTELRTFTAASLRRTLAKLDSRYNGTTSIRIPAVRSLLTDTLSVNVRGRG
jgi:hypothetical protein